jgi:hypothetical protein
MPLAEIALEDCRQLRLKHGHSDIRAGDIVGLWPNEVAKRDEARKALAEQKGYPPFLIPCPICNGVEGCDHTVMERARAEAEKRRKALTNVRAIATEEEWARGVVARQAAWEAGKPSYGRSPFLDTVEEQKLENEHLRRTTRAKQNRNDL